MQVNTFRVIDVNQSVRHTPTLSLLCCVALLPAIHRRHSKVGGHHVQTVNLLVEESLFDFHSLILSKKLLMHRNFHENEKCSDRVSSKYVLDRTENGGETNLTRSIRSFCTISIEKKTEELLLFVLS